MGSSVLSRIQIIMEANTASYNNEMRKARENSSTTFEKIGKSAGKAALVVGTALAGMGALSVKTAMSFETAMAEVNKTADFLTEDGLGNLRKELEDLSKTMPLAFEELADIAASGGQMGIAGENLAQFTETIAKMGIAFDISAGQAAESMGFIASAYQVPIEKLGEVGDAINQVSNSSGATADKTIDFMLRTGAAANNMNIAAEATAAMGAAIIDAGGSVEKSGTAVSNMMLSLANPYWLESSADILKGMGVSTTEFSKLVRTDGLEAFMMLREGVMSTDDPMTTLIDLFDAGAPHIAKLFDETSKFVPLLDAVGQGAEGAATHIGSLDNEYRVMADTTANAFVLIKNSATLVADAFGTALLPAVREITDALIPMIQKVAEWTKANPELVRQIFVVGGALVGSILSLKLFADSVMAVKSTIEGLKLAFSAAKIGIGMLGSPIGLAVIGIGILIAAGLLLYQNWDLVKAKAVELGNLIKAVFDGLPAPVKTAMQFIWGNIKATFDIIKTVFVTSWGAIKAIWDGNWAQAGRIVAQSMAKIVSIIGERMQAAWTIVKNVFSSMVSSVASSLSNMRTAVANKFNEIKNSITTTLSNLPGRMITIGKQIVTGLVNGIKNGASSVANAIGNVASGMVAKAKSVLGIASPSKVTTKIGLQTAEGMAVGINKGAKAVKSEAQKMAEGAIKAVKDGIINLQKELALFGDSSKLSDFNYDVKIGKYNGASQNDINETRELLKRLALRNDENDVVKEMILIQRSIYDASVLQSTELGRMNYELDDIHGKYKGIGEAMKDSLRVEAAKLDAVKLSASAAKTMLDIDRQMSLLDNDSMFNQWAFDLTDAAGSMVNLDEAMKDALLTKIADYEQAKKASEINNSIADSLEAIKRETALLNDSSPLANFLYDLNETDKFAHAAGESIVDLGDALTALQATKDRISSRDALKGMLSGLEQQSPMGKIIADYESRNEIIATFEQLHTDLVATANEARLASDSAYMNAKQQLMIGQSGAIFSALTGMAKGFLGEQSGIYRALYTVQKSYTLASALLSSKKAIMDAWSDTAGGYFAKSLAVGKVILSTSEITSAIAGLAPDGFKSGGYTGNMGVDQIAGPVHGQEFVFDAPATKRIGVNNLERMRSGNVAGGGDINVNVTVSMEGKSSVESDSAMGKQVGQGLAAVVVGEVRKMMRPNGEMDRVYAKR